MIITALAYAIKFIWLIFKAVFYIGFVIVFFITIGAFIAAIFKVFPVVGIILAIILLSVAIYCIVSFIKKRKVGAIHESPEK